VNDLELDPVTVDCQVTTDDMRLAARLAAKGVGIALLPLLTASSSAAPGKLVRLLANWAVPDVSLRLITPARALEPMAARLFREGLLLEPWARAARRRQPAPAPNR
jgi:DNA-binding transcriptional LysR family regulator